MGKYKCRDCLYYPCNAIGNRRKEWTECPARTSERNLLEAAKEMIANFEAMDWCEGEGDPLAEWKAIVKKAEGNND